uniref:Protein TIC 214 n=1 Tax=Commiphora gileadensis TaxID=1700993 RepID=A0A410PAD6_9ROSI|nr:hypothetical chloroplast RF19 [Commiphora gileadensis]QAT19758.1 hypothetical chloroplast RF19 [Commiphora gileadensis]
MRKSSILMHEDNQFGRCGRTLLWISDHILHRALLSLPSPSSGYGRRRRRNREEGISNNWFYCGTAHDVHIDLLCASASSIGKTSYNNCPSSTVSFVSFLLEQSQTLFRLWIYYQKFNAKSKHSMGIPEKSHFSIIQPFHFTKFNVSQISQHLYVSMQQQDVICNKSFCWLVNWSHFIHEMGWIGISLDTAKEFYKVKCTYSIKKVPCARIEKFQGSNLQYSLIYYLYLLFRQNTVTHFDKENESERNLRNARKGEKRGRNRCRNRNNFRNEGDKTGTRGIHRRRSFSFPFPFFGTKGKEIFIMVRGLRIRTEKIEETKEIRVNGKEKKAKARIPLSLKRDRRKRNLNRNKRYPPKKILLLPFPFFRNKGKRNIYYGLKSLLRLFFSTINDGIVHFDIKKNAVRDEMSQYFFYTCRSDGKERISFTYPESLSTFLEMIQKKMSFLTKEKVSPDELYNHWSYTNEQKRSNLNKEFINRIEVLDKGSLTLDVLEKRTKLCNDETKKKIFTKNIRSSRAWTFSGKNQKIIFTQNPKRNFDQKKPRKVLDKKDTYSPSYKRVSRFSRIRTDNREIEKKTFFYYQRSNNKKKKKIYRNCNKQDKKKKFLGGYINKGMIYKQTNNKKKKKIYRNCNKQDKKKKFLGGYINKGMIYKQKTKKMWVRWMMEFVQEEPDMKRFLMITCKMPILILIINILIILLKKKIREFICKNRIFVEISSKARCAHKDVKPLLINCFKQMPIPPFFLDRLDKPFSFNISGLWVWKKKDQKTFRLKKRNGKNNLTNKRRKEEKKEHCEQEQKPGIIFYFLKQKEVICYKLNRFLENIFYSPLRKKLKISPAYYYFKFPSGLRISKIRIGKSILNAPIMVFHYPKQNFRKTGKQKVFRKRSFFLFARNPGTDLSYNLLIKIQYKHKKLIFVFKQFGGWKLKCLLGRPESDIRFLNPFLKNSKHKFELSLFKFSKFKKKEQEKNLFEKLQKKQTNVSLKVFYFEKEEQKTFQKETKLDREKKMTWVKLKKIRKSVIRRFTNRLFKFDLRIGQIYHRQKKKRKDLTNRTNRIRKEIEKNYKRSEKKDCKLKKYILVRTNQVIVLNYSNHQKRFGRYKKEEVLDKSVNPIFFKNFSLKGYTKIFFYLSLIFQGSIQNFFLKKTSTIMKQIRKKLIKQIKIKFTLFQLQKNHFLRLVIIIRIQRFFVIYLLSHNPKHMYFTNYHKPKLLTFRIQDLPFNITEHLFFLRMKKKMILKSKESFITNYEININPFGILERMNGKPGKGVIININTIYLGLDGLDKYHKNGEIEPINTVRLRLKIKIKTKGIHMKKTDKLSTKKKKKNLFETDSLRNQKSNFKKLYRYDLLSYKFLNYEDKKDTYLHRSLFQVKNNEEFFLKLQHRERQIIWYDGRYPYQKLSKRRRYYGYRANSGKKIFRLENSHKKKGRYRILGRYGRESMMKYSVVLYQIRGFGSSQNLCYFLMHIKRNRGSYQSNYFFSILMEMQIVIKNITGKKREYPFISSNQKESLEFENGSKEEKDPAGQGNPRSDAQNQVSLGSVLSNQERDVEEKYAGSDMKKRRKYKSNTQAQLYFLLKKHLRFQLRWYDLFNPTIINNIKIYCLLLRLRNPREIAISSIQRGEFSLNFLMVEKDLTITELMKRGILIIEPLRLSVKNDGQFFLYQTIGISLVHKTKRQFNKRYREGGYVNKNNFAESIPKYQRMVGTRDKNHYDLLVPENILFPKRRRELRTLICFNSKNRNGLRGYVLDKSKDFAREKKKLINLKFFLWPNYRLEDLVCMNRYWFNTNNGSRFSMVRIQMYPQLKIHKYY